VPTRAAEQPTFTYQGQRFFWGYSPDRQICGLWEVENPSAAPHKTWPISEHEAAWQVFRSLEPRAATCDALEPESSVSHESITSRPTSRDSSPLFVSYGTGTVQAGANGNGHGHGNSLEIAISNGNGNGDGLSSSDGLSSGDDLADVDGVADDCGELHVGSAPAPFELKVEGSPPTTERTRWKRLGLIAALSAVVVAGAVFGVKSLGPKPAVVDPLQVVLTAATTTQGLHSAHMSMTETITGVKGAGTITVPVSGEIDFSSGSSSLTMTIDGEHVSVVSAGGTMFMNIPQISQLVPGKSWVSVPEGSSGSAAGGALSGGDPSQMLRYLASEGNTVSAIGSSTLDGVPVQGYSVTVNKQAVDSELSRSGLSPSIVQSAESFLDAVGPITFKVYVDSLNELREMDFSMAVPGVSGASVSAQLTFSDFGSPVAVSPPPQSEVASLQQFLYGAEQAAGGSSSGV